MNTYRIHYDCSTAEEVEIGHEDVLAESDAMALVIFGFYLQGFPRIWNNLLTVGITLLERGSDEDQ